MSSLEGLTLGVRLFAPTDKILEAIKDEPLLIYYVSGESHYITWNQILPLGMRKVEIDKWMGAAPWTELINAINRVCVAASEDPTLNYGSLRVYIKYPYTSHHSSKIRTFIPPTAVHAPHAPTSDSKSKTQK